MIRMHTSSQAKPAADESSPAEVGKKLNETICAASKKPISSTSREQVSLKQFWNKPQEREISYTSQQNQIPQIKNRKEKNDNSQCEHPDTTIKKMHAKQNSSFLWHVYDRIM